MAFGIILVKLKQKQRKFLNNQLTDTNLIQHKLSTKTLSDSKVVSSMFLFQEKPKHILNTNRDRIGYNIISFDQWYKWFF